MKVPFINPKQNGFTLIELLLTLAIFGVMMSLVSTSFFQFHAQNKRVQEEISLRQEMRSLERLIRKDLGNAVYLTRFMKNGNGNGDGRNSGILAESVPSAAGGEDRLYLHVAGKSLFFRGNLQTIDPHLHEVGYLPKIGDQGRLHLIRREQFYIDSNITDGEGIQHSLTGNLKSFKMLFLDSSSLEPLSSWTPSSANPMPDAVKVVIQLEEETGGALKSEFTVNIRPKMGAHVKWEVQ